MKSLSVDHFLSIFIDFSFGGENHANMLTGRGSVTRKTTLISYRKLVKQTPKDQALL